MDHSPPLPPIQTNQPLYQQQQQQKASPILSHHQISSPPIQLAKLKLFDDNRPSTTTGGGLLPTPVSPALPYGSFISQFSIKQQATAVDSSPSAFNNNNSNKQYACTECHQVFYRAHNLKSHKATHNSSNNNSSTSASTKPYQVNESIFSFDKSTQKKLGDTNLLYSALVVKSNSYDYTI